MVDFRINVVIDSRNAATGASAVERRLAALERRAMSLKGVFGRLGGALGAALTFRAIQEQLDGYTALQNRLKAVTRAGEDLGKVNEDLLQVANRSRSSLQEVGRIYSRLSINSKSLGISQAELIDFTETLSKTIAISGATTYEAAGALTQFSQAMASSALRGDELRSILEQLPEVSNVIAKRFGVSSGELAKLGEQGLITSKQIIAAFKDSREEIEERFSRTAPTISQAFTVLKNQILVTLGELDKGAKFSETFAKSIIFVAKNIDVVIQVIKNLVLFLGPRYLYGAIVKLTVALAANPIGFLITAIAVAAAVIPEFQAEIDAVTASIVKLAEEVLGVDFSNLDPRQILQDAAMTVAKWVDGVVANLNGFIAAAAQVWVEFTSDPKVALQLTKKAFFDTLEAIIDFFVAFARTIGDILYGIGSDVADVTKGIGSVFSKLFAADLDGALAAADGITAALANIPKRVLDAGKTFSAKYAEEQASRLVPEVLLDEKAQNAANRIAGAFAAAVEDSVPNAQNAVKKLFEINTNSAQQLGLQAALAFGTGIMLYRDQSQENIENALLGPVRFPAMTPNNPRFTPQKKGFGARPEAPPGATIPLPPQGLAANLAAAGVAPDDPYAKALESLKAITVVEATRIIQGDLIAAQLQARYDIEREGVALSQQQVAELAKFVELSSDAQALAGLTKQIDQMREFNEQQRLLNLLMEKRPDLAAEINQKLFETKLAALESSRELGDGFERAFMKASESATNYANMAETAFNSFVGNTADALSNFVMTGKANFKELAMNFLSDIARMISQALVFKMIQSSLGFVGINPASWGFGGGKAEGGPVQKGRTYVVGERGPEIFRPNTGGTIIPNDKMGASAAPPQVNVQVVNVEDPKKIPQTISGGGADEAILNVLSRRRDAVKRALS